MKKVYHAVGRLVHKWTGNGPQGDPDVNDILKQFSSVKGTTDAVEGMDVLSEDIIRKFMDKNSGWFEMFEERFKTDPSAKRVYEYRDGVLSEPEKDKSDDEGNDTDTGSDLTPAAKPPPATPAPPKRTPSGTANTPKNQQYVPGVPQTPHSEKVNSKRTKSTVKANSDSDLNANPIVAFMERSIAIAESSHELQKAEAESRKEKLEVLKRRVASEDEGRKMQQYREMLGDPNLDSDTKDLVRKALTELITRSIGLPL
ncbi:hypothetical protein NMY22_g6884 [Coprinellus aureogranulatus]|nr:hypothetical protein NMY22_g6884 [Coprinellus aureogranulatus]